MGAPKVGDTVWLFNANRGRTVREHWFFVRISDATKQSWILSGGRSLKVDKATGLLRGAEVAALRRKVEFSQDVVEADIRRDENRHRLLRTVESADVDTLKAIDALLKADAAKKAST